MLSIRIKRKLNSLTRLNDKYHFVHKPSLAWHSLRISNPNSEPFKHELASWSQFEYSILH